MNAEFIKTLEEERSQLQEKLDAVSKILRLYSPDADARTPDEPFHPIPEQYRNTNLSKRPSQMESPDVLISKSKVLAYIESVGKFVKAIDIIEGLGLPSSNPTYRQRMSNVLGALKTAGKVNTYKIENRNIDTRWGLSEWFENGAPNEEYIQENKKALVSA